MRRRATAPAAGHLDARRRGRSTPVDLAWRPGDTALYVVAQHGADLRRVSGEAPSVVLDIDDLTDKRWRAGTARAGVQPRRNEGVRQLHRQQRRHQRRRAHRSEPTACSIGDSLRTVLFVEQPYPNHNGGDLAFGPGRDALHRPRRRRRRRRPGASRPRPDRTARQDAAHRPVDPVGRSRLHDPGRQPVRRHARRARGEIWSVGLRNPWRYSFDPETGDLWIADVGQGDIEEINVAPATDGIDAGRGSNFGWSGYEGSQRFNDDVTAENHSGPIFEYDHSGGRCSISGGVRAAVTAPDRSPGGTSSPTTAPAR